MAKFYERKGREMGNVLIDHGRDHIHSLNHASFHHGAMVGYSHGTLMSLVAFILGGLLLRHGYDHVAMVIIGLITVVAIFTIIRTAVKKEAHKVVADYAVAKEAARSNRPQRKRCPSHPGELFLEEYLRPHNMSIEDAARATGLDLQTITRWCEGSDDWALTPHAAKRISSVVGGTPQFWLKLQNNYNIGKVGELPGGDAPHPPPPPPPTTDDLRKSSV